MWKYNSDYNKWYIDNDSISKPNFDYQKQELNATRFYSRCLSGSVYLPINDTSNVYDIMDKYQPRNWYISTSGSQYSVTPIPSRYATPITTDSSYMYYTKYLSEYGLTLKNLFTPYRLIKDSSKNFYYVDVATTRSIDLSAFSDGQIDDVKLLNGHRILVKNQTTNIVLLNTTDPDTYFTSNYEVVENLGGTIEYKYYNNENGIYLYKNSKLVRDADLDNYDTCVRYSASVKMGTVNIGKQFHLSRLLDGYFPMTILNQPIEFQEKHNWVLRNKMDYNNLFEINYYDIIKHGTQSYNFEGLTYSIPERTISVGEFGVILNTQEGKSNIINNKYKVNLRSICETTKYYWICGDDNILIRVNKHDFTINRIDISTRDSNIISNLKSISFFDDLHGVVVGELNKILYTEDGGQSWYRIEMDNFNEYNYNKVLVVSNYRFYVIGDRGIFIEFVNNISGWVAYKKRISQIEDDTDEYILVDNINDMYKTTLSNWNVSYNYFTQSISVDKELLFLVTDNNKFIAYDINNSFSAINGNFIYFNFSDENYNNIRNIIQRKDTNYFYFTATDPYTNNDGIFEFNIDDFNILGVGNLYSNTIIGPSASLINASYPNKILDYVGDELLICGNNSLLGVSMYSVINFNSLDSSFGDKLKSKLLFLDYDIASKLNFFTDDGEYRLPNSITFSNINLTIPGLTSSPKISFDPILHTQTTINNGTYSELNWISYWLDSQKTFEYYSNKQLDKSTEVLISTTFSYTPIITSTTFSYTQISISISDMKKLAPAIIYATASRYCSIGLSPSVPSVSRDIYLYDYLMVYKVPIIYPVNIGDVIKLESDVVDANLIVNKILILSGYKYIYMYTEFNQNIITELSKTANLIKIINLNKYSNNDELKNRFNIHPISNAYKLEYTSNSNIFKLSAVFNNLTSYYNLQTSVTVYDNSIKKYDMVYNDNFLKFGYSPTYNLLDYLINISDSNVANPIFYSTKEYLSMPIYERIPLGDLTDSNAYINYNGLTYSLDIHNNQIVKNRQDNKISFGKGLKLEWDSIFINTFVDVIIHDTSDYITEKLLVMKKYYDSFNDSYVIEFHKGLNYDLDITFGDNANLDIISRRKLYQISEDLQELNNIQKTQSWLDDGVFKYSNYDNELNFKIPTDSYAKILLSDVDTIQNLSGIIYIDYKNELAMNITTFIEQYEIQIVNVQSYIVPGDSFPKLVIECMKKHDLLSGDGVVLDFDGVIGSSDYNGYHVITKINDYTFLTNINYTTTPIVGLDTNCYVRYTKVDPFLNYEPVDLIDLGSDLKGKMALELTTDNTVLINNKFNLINVDYNKYRFRLIDGLDINIINTQFSWILEADLSGAIIGINANNDLVWYKGTWLYGRWFGGVWMSGVWMSGDWYDGIWNSHIISDNILSCNVDTQTVDINQSFWYGGRWYDGIWNNGTWNNGRWYDGTWNSGTWYKGIWNNGTWNNGDFEGGIWLDGIWNNGIFNCNVEPSYWLYGKWYGGDFENGMWYNGIWEQRNNESRFGTKSSNSRTANWQAGTWVSGSFFSFLNRNDTGELMVSDVHKYSIWKTGKWLSGEWYGGIAYNIDFKTGTWYGGILEDIEVIGIDSTNNAFTLNGIFKFNIGDEIYIIDNQIGNSYSVYGSNLNPHKYKIIYTIEDKQTTIVYVNENLDSYNANNIDTGLRIISKFENINWKSGIWTNGLFDNGLWESGIWYNGVFNGIWS